MNRQSRQANKWITQAIEDFVIDSPDNSLQLESGEKAWDNPMVGFARGSDPYFSFFKEDIGGFYWSPKDVFDKKYPVNNTSLDQLNVISWVIPHARQIKIDHRQASRIPSERWSRARLYGEEFNNKLRQYVVNNLVDAGFRAVSPILLPSFKREYSTKYGYASTWSERHTAFTCGLGTFGLSDGLITPLGKAVRFGSVVTNMKAEPSERSYNGAYSYCLYYRDQSCRKCAERCPADAISEKGHDKIRCRDYIRNELIPAIKTNYNIDIYACGLCQTGVPCESRIPCPDQVDKAV